MAVKDMPSPWARNALRFNYEKPEELNRYIWRLEELFSKNGIENDKTKIKWLGTYADARTEKELEAMPTFDEGNFTAHIKEIIESYPEASNEARDSIKELKRIRDAAGNITCQDLGKLQAYKRAFTAEAKRLQKEPALMSNHEAIEYFLKPLSDGFRKKIIDKLDIIDLVNPDAENKNRRPEDRFPLEKFIATAISIAHAMQKHGK
ncbi:hypothetical protein M413DRAFT_22993 [Hebeloma cylindrosporum]|uniref:Uncharacterized protein n=1 Tax=Hebeloma cylindrosporum TaxID=76867 RepID=A0A0C3BIL6_HEBCY|nr:hypothetical protein M413DRAFT_33055 [Hebeloma cylindrosporum h7]KIM36545.1 hypothetical protein M413DRAFT_31593 [Hebeloma cylindrosporum h7]KIM46593.1 hypothetical protein M413DRAFT_22993 [Hebeloma cylindrosporum h7]